MDSPRFDQNLLHDYLAFKGPRAKDRVNQSKLVAVDFETTGLEKDDQIISMGFCPINNNKIKLADCLHILLKPEQALSHDSVTIHGITDDQLQSGLTPEAGLEKFLELTKNAVIIAHYHTVERRYIQNLANLVLRQSIPLYFVDTFQIAKQRMERRNLAITPRSLRLFNLRQQYGLPNYKAHNALEDAIATAELFLAQVSSLNQDLADVRFKDLKLFHYKN